MAKCQFLNKETALACLAVVADAAAGSSNYQLACRRHSGTFVFIVSVVWPLAALTALFWRGGVGAGLNACWPKLQSFIALFSSINPFQIKIL